MKIKFMGRELVVSLVSVPASLNSDLGSIEHYLDRIVIKDCSDNLDVALHEIAHNYLFRFGKVLPKTEEQYCDQVAQIICALLRENGFDVFEKMQEFLNK